MKTPCSNCPFRKDIPEGWLGAERMEEIIQADSFVCHKTTSGSMRERRQCAGHMIMLGEKNAFVQLAKSVGEDLGLYGNDLVFDSTEDCINHHEY